MDEGFHVTRTQQHTTGMPPIPLGTVADLAPSPAVYGPGAGAELARLFPAGLTAHGRQYMTEFNPQAAPTWALECFLEAVRRAEFDALPSRMQSVFAFETLSDAKAFVGGFRNGQPCAIYRVRGRTAHRANMSLLNTMAAPGAVAFTLARSYWLGEQGPRPPLWELLLRPPVEFAEVVEGIVT
jgi:hypothetical protein